MFSRGPSAASATRATSITELASSGSISGASVVPGTCSST
jgi:hypothetical protein